MSNHVVGIVPLVTEPMDFNLDWHDSLMPIAPNYYAVERAVLECAYAGCKTIWIVANDDTINKAQIGRLHPRPSLARQDVTVSVQ